MRAGWKAATAAVLACAAFVVLAGSVAARQQAPPSVPLDNARVVMFASDGMRPDLMEKYANAGAMPTYQALMNAGVRGDNGMLQAFPPNTGVGWYTMATGAYPGEHGSTNNTFFRSGDTFSNRTSFSATNLPGPVLQADTLAEAAERAGKKVAQIEWVGGIQASNRGFLGPTVDFALFYSNRGVLVGQSDPSEQAGAAAFGTNYQVASPAPATGWAGVPLGDPAAPPMEATWSIPTSFAPNNPSRTYNVYFYDSAVNGSAAYDHVVVSPVGKTGAAPSVDLAVGNFKPIRLMGADGLIGSRAGQTVGHYVKLISLSSNLSNFKLYATSLARPVAKCGTAACNALPAGGPGEDKLEKYIADNLPVFAAADFAPLEGGVIDEETYVQQGRDLEAAYGNAVLDYILGTLQPNTDLAMVGYPFTDEVSHQFMALVTPTVNGAANPCYDVMPKFDDTQCVGPAAGRVAVREGYIRSAYHEADTKLGMARSLMGGNPTTFAGSDHGFAPQWYAVNAQAVLNGATVNGISLHASNANASNCGGAPVVLTPPPANAYVSGDLAKACWAGGTIQIYVNTTLPAGTTYEQVRTAAVNAFQNLTDPANPGAQVVAKILKKEELRNVDGSDSLHPNRSGDVVVVLKVPYQSDAGTNNQKVALSHFFGQHGYLPNYVDLASNANMHATFVAAGPGIRKQDPVAGVRAVDLAPTVAMLMGVPGPQNARGKIMTNLFPSPGRYKELTILDISDYHGQLIPLSEAADTVGPSFGIGGAAFLKPWFDLYRGEAPNGSITVAGGDSVGATPPISSFFGDTPTIDLMNMMGFSLDGLGNHNFDRGQAYLRGTLIPLATFPYVSANIVDSAGKTPAEWSPSHVFDTAFGGSKLGVVGYSNDDLPTLISPTALPPFHVSDSLTAVNAEAAKLKGKGIGPIIALGHLGATGGTPTNPSGPLIAFADGLSNVDAVIGDHTDFQVDTTRPNGVLVTENRSKGIRFTRVRLIVDSSTKAVIYKTADFHKPWDIGVTPDAAIQAKIDQLNAQLAPIMNTKLGDSTVFIPRADQCGNSLGRKCESLVGNTVTDSMRTAYASIGVQFAITNSGGLRADLTCPTADNPSDFCPASLYPIPNPGPRYPITRGQVLTVLPFGNVVSTVAITGTELKAFLENGVSGAPETLPLKGLTAQGRFAQVSGLCFTYDIAAPSGSRVTGAVLANPNGTCSATPIDLTAGGGPYKIAENDFMASGGDGYPVTTGKPTYATQAIMDQVLADHIGAATPISPAIQARIVCTDGNGPGVTPDCAP